MAVFERVVLVILDGWGLTPEATNNAIIAAKTPVMDTLCSKDSFLSLQSSGQAVGLPWGEIGNSEVGHITLGTGRVVLSDFAQISETIRTGTFFNNSILTQTLHDCFIKKSKLHIIGIATNNGIHGHVDHICAIAEAAAQVGIEPIIHVITDGRDSPPQSAKSFITQISKTLQKLKKGKIVSLVGRYYAMDRDRHWDRTQAAYQLYTQRFENEQPDFETALQVAYGKGETDEFISPVQLTGYEPIGKNDAVIMTNFRSDRALQLTKSFVDTGFNYFKRDYIPLLSFTTMTQYAHNVPTQPLFSVVALNNPRTNPLTNSLAEVISEHKLVQVHVAESEKFPHVTYFFNAGREQPFPGEHRIIVQSPKVPTYDQKPEMSAENVTDQFLHFYSKQKPTFSVINFANADMVGHTGNMKATITAIETVDRCLQKLLTNVLDPVTAVLITGDHGNAEQLMIPGTDTPDKEHTVNPVPLCFVFNEDKQLIENATSVSTEQKVAYSQTQPVGLLADVAPTILSFLGIEKPKEMTGVSLYEKS